MTLLMHGFPPTPEGQVTLRNWRTTPFHKWAFQHLREIVPSADIANDPDTSLEFLTEPVDMAGLRFDLGGGRSVSIDEFFDDTDTDGLVLARCGKIIYERYANGMTAETPHMLMSVSKSVLGILAGILTAKGLLDPERPITDLIPEVARTAYRGATIRQLLDMRAGVVFEEDYLASSGAIIAYRKAMGWNPHDPNDPPHDLRSFYQLMTESDGKHGGPFHYVSPNTDLLGWAMERATGERYPDLMSKWLWKPMRARRSAYVSVDRLGAARAAGGVCSTVRDLARLGQLIVDGGMCGGIRIIPVEWLDDITENGDQAAWDAGDFAVYYPGLPMRYRSKWYVQGGRAPILFGLGIHGQNVFVDLQHQIVVAKVSSQVLPLDPERIALTTKVISQLASLLSN